jgi:hypothetical protein
MALSEELKRAIIQMPQKEMRVRLFMVQLDTNLAQLP